MIVHARVAKLQRHMGDPAFDRIMAHIEASGDEGIDAYELEVQRLNDDMKYDLIDALTAMGYDAEYFPDEETIQVAIGD